jgi:hypothetical protein
MSMEFVYIWWYEVREGRELEFETLYGPDGGWAHLFRKSVQYLGTDLLRDRDKERGYVTIDRWESESAYRGFVVEHRDEFAELDRQGEQFTTKETPLGEFNAVKGVRASRIR